MFTVTTFFSKSFFHKSYQPQPLALADNSYLDFDYSGYHKNLIQYFFNSLLEVRPLGGPSPSNELANYYIIAYITYSVFSHGVMTAMLVSQTKPLGIAFCFYANSFFCFSKPIWPIVT